MTDHVSEGEFFVVDDGAAKSNDLVVSRKRQRKRTKPTGEPMEGVTFDDILNASVNYDEWTLPFTGSERTAILLGCVSIVVGMIVVNFAKNVGMSGQLADYDFLPGLSDGYDLWVSTLVWLQPVVFVGNLVAGTLAVVLWDNTSLEAGIEGWHQIGVGISIWGAAQAVLVLLPVAFTLFYFVTWTVLTVLAIVVGIFAIVFVFIFAGVGLLAR